jgi:hypothetical protein
MSKKRIKRKAATHSAGAYDNTRQMFLLPKDRINEKRYGTFRNWLSKNTAAINWVLDNLHLAKRNNDGLIRSAETEVLLLKSRLLQQIKGSPWLPKNLEPYTRRHLVWLYHERTGAHLNLFAFVPLKGDGTKHRCPYCRCSEIPKAS